jgi:hypothetical protein
LPRTDEQAELARLTAENRRLALLAVARDRMLREHIVPLDLEPTALSSNGANGDSARALPAPFLLEGDTPPPVREHVEQMLIANDVNLFAGPGGSGKSTVLQHVAACVAIGRPVFGTLRVHQAGPVLLVVPEDGFAVVRVGMEAIIEALNPTDVERATLAKHLRIVPDQIEVGLPRDARKLGYTVAETGAVLLLLDPLANLIGDQDENARGVATLVISALREHVCRAALCTVLMSHHTRKPPKERGTSDPDRNDVSGNSGWVNGSRAVWGVTKKGNRITLASWKANRTRGDGRHELDLEVETDPENKAHWLRCDLRDANAGATSEALTPGVGRSLNANELAALTVLDDQHEPGLRLSFSQWCKRSGINDRTFQDVRTRLLSAGLADAFGTGKKARSGAPEFVYSITADGRRVLLFGGKPWKP